MMTKNDLLLARRSARILAALLVATAATVPLAACSSNDKPPAGSGATTSGGVPGRGDAAGDAGKGDGSTDDSSVVENACHAVANTAPMFPISFDPADRPPPLGGGAITDGTYFETSEVRYAQASARPPIMSGGVTLVIAGTSLSFGRYTTEKAYVPTTAIFTIDRADADALDGGDAGAAGADTIVFHETCPAAGASLGRQDYAVSGNDLTISFGTYTVTYTRQ